MVQLSHNHLSILPQEKCYFHIRKKNLEDWNWGYRCCRKSLGGFTSTSFCPFSFSALPQEKHSKEYPENPSFVGELYVIIFISRQICISGSPQCRNFQRAGMDDDVTQLTPTHQVMQSLAMLFEFSNVIFPVLLWLELYCMVHMLRFSSLTPPCLLLLAVGKPPPFWSLVCPPLPWIILKFSDVTMQLWTWRGFFFFGLDEIDKSFSAPSF